MVKKEDGKKREGCCRGFFSPTISKVIIFVIVLIILLMLIKPRIVCANCVNCPCSLEFMSVDHDIMMVISLDTSFNSIPKSNLLIYFIYLTEIIISYILSCLIILVYNKIRGQR